MIGVNNLDFSKIGRMQQIGKLMPQARPVHNLINNFASNPFANIAKTGSINGNMAKNQNLIINNGTINIGDKNSNNGNTNEAANNNDNFIKQLILMLVQMLQHNKQDELAKNNPFGMQGAGLF